MRRLLVATTMLCALPLAAAAGVIGTGTQDSAYTGLAAGYTSVGQIYGADASGHFAASGVVIDKNWVLTAAHVTSGATGLSFYYGDSGGSWDSFGSRAHVDATAWYSYSKWTGSLSNGYDIGLMRFDTDLTKLCGAYCLTSAQRYAGTAEVGKVGTAVGYGMTGTGSTGATTFDGLKRAGTNTIDAVALTPGGSNRILLTDFDDGTTANNSYGSATPLGLEYMIAPGDSGGGLFIDQLVNGALQHLLAGITSFGWGRIDGNPDSDYGDVGGFTRVTYFNSWIDSMISGTAGNPGGPKKRPGGGFDLQASALVEVPEPPVLLVLLAGVLALACRRRLA